MVGYKEEILHITPNCGDCQATIITFRVKCTYVRVARGMVAGEGGCLQTIDRQFYCSRAVKGKKIYAPHSRGSLRGDRF